MQISKSSALPSNYQITYPFKSFRHPESGSANLLPSRFLPFSKSAGIIRPLPKSIFGVHDPKGLSYLTQLRVGLCKMNFHKFRHNFRDTINPMCISNDGIEDTEHFLLLFPTLDIQRGDLLAGVLALVRPFGLSNPSNEVLTQLLMYGNKDFPDEINGNILELTLYLIHETGRLIEFVQIFRHPSSSHQVPLLLNFPFEYSYM